MSATADFARDYNIDVFDVNEYDSYLMNTQKTLEIAVL